MQTSVVFQRLGIDAEVSYVDNIENTNSISLSLNESAHFTTVEWNSSDGGRLIIDSKATNRARRNTYSNFYFIRGFRNY